MRKIALMCSGGMSTSLLMTHMREAAKREGYACEIEAFGLCEQVKVKSAAPDILLLAPQARFGLAELRRTMSFPIELIDMAAYGKIDGERVLDQARRALGD